ncbi:MAG TPA: acyltransferase family protein [Bacillota bacterium]|nr:acyltransferase family protein [Bacillota bacterium]
MQRDKTMDVLMAIGIIYVVLGHNHQPAFIPFRAYSFHMALFFFISGYFFKPRYGFAAKWEWLRKKATKLLVPYFSLNVIFAFLTIFLKTKNIDLGQQPSFYSLWIAPWLHGHQFTLFAPAWFVIQLFIVHIIYQNFFLKPYRLAPYLITGGLVVLAILLVNTSRTGMSRYEQIAVRTGFSLAFYSIGFLYAINKDKINRYLLQAKVLLMALTGYGILESLCQPLTYELIWARFLNVSPLVPFASSLLVIVIFINLARGFVALFPQNNLVYSIGQHTFPIMCFHLTVFFGINLILCLLGIVEYENLSHGNYRWNADHIWFIYSVPGVLIPMYVTMACKKLLQYWNTTPFRNRMAA